MSADEQLERRSEGYVVDASEEGKTIYDCAVCDEPLCAHGLCPNPLCLNGPCERCGREEVKHAA